MTVIDPNHVVEVADVVVQSLSPFVEADWSVRAGSLEWSVERTISHMIGAPAKYTLYLASQSPRFIALTCSRFEDATQAEMIESIRPVAKGLANVARWTPPGTTAFHADGPQAPTGFVTMACVELLAHTHDALEGLGGHFHPPDELARAVLEVSFPHMSRCDAAWAALIEATGRRLG